MSHNIKLSSGYDCPLVGYGTFLANDPVTLKEGLKVAIKAGYRHIDTAYLYKNEAVIGETLQELYSTNVVKREDLFITTKLFSTQFRPDLVVPMLKKQLSLLQTDYVDLYLMHNPYAMKPPVTGDLDFSGPDQFVLDFGIKIEDTWAAMESCVKQGMARSIGVSNFSIKQVEKVLHSGTIQPVMNQVEVQPFFQNRKLSEFCRSHNIYITAYSQFGRPSHDMCDIDVLNDEHLVAIGAKYGKSAAQVIMRWLFQSSIVAIPKSTTPSRIEGNFNIWDFQLSNEDMAEIASLDKNRRFCWLPNSKANNHPEFPFVPDGSSC